MITLSRLVPRYVQDKHNVHSVKLCSNVLPHIHEFDTVCLLSRGVDNVDDLMAEIAEQQDLALEISEAISKPYGFNEDFDEVRVAWWFSPRHKLLLRRLLMSGEHFLAHVKYVLQIDAGNGGRHFHCADVWIVCV